MHKGTGLLLSLLITTIILVMLVYFFLRNQAQSTGALSSLVPASEVSSSKSAAAVDSAEPGTLVTPVKNIQPQIQLKKTQKALEDANRKILENANAIENMQ